MHPNSNFLKENNARHMWHPMAHPAEMLAHPPKVISAAEGVMITDIDGHKTIDAVGGLWNVNLGYSCQPIKDAITRQLDELAYYSAFRGTSTAPAIELSAMLAEWFEPDGMVRSFFTSGGSDSIETALRLARQYHKQTGERDRTKFISIKKGYHGTHFGGASVNGNANFRRNYEPLMPGCFQIPAPYTYRNPFNETDPAKLAAFCAQALEDEIQFQGPDTVAAFIMEPVLGAGGVIPPHESFMPKVREICDRYGILLIADEVITAFGRTGAWTGSRLWNVKPDMMAVAKAITNGYFPFGATMISEKVANVFESNTDSFGMIGHGYTYSAHPVGAAAALACVPAITEARVNDNAAARGTELLTAAEALKEKYALVGDVRGKGLMVALEMVSDRESKTPADKATIATFHDKVYEAGVMVRVSGPNIILSPPLVITSDDVQTIASALDAGLAAATQA
ncbi:MAG: aspartate aminotransferase family protein [Gammaproteobacteria bacterium]|nr:aspartate aminotransferase family protein [Gammaproteobacteria bacterium]